MCLFVLLNPFLSIFSFLVKFSWCHCFALLNLKWKKQNKNKTTKKVSAILILAINLSASFFYQESTKITLAPSNADIHAGDDTWMECAASYDPSVDITFIWSLNGRVIDLHKENTHYESILVSNHWYLVWWGLNVLLSWIKFLLWSLMLILGYLKWKNRVQLEST